LPRAGCNVNYFNSKLNDLCTFENVTYIENARFFLLPDNSVAKPLYFIDGIHLNNHGIVQLLRNHNKYVDIIDRNRIVNQSVNRNGNNAYEIAYCPSDNGHIETELKENNDEIVQKCIKICSLNVYDLISKLMNPDFRTFTESYDILIFQESKIDELDLLELLNDYMCFAKHRRNAKAKSGGIVIVFKRYLLKSLTFISSESEFVQWVRVSKDIFTIDSDIYLNRASYRLLVTSLPTFD